ncbi:cyclase family protein [soil metagenome]
MIIDLSVQLTENTPVYPGDPKPEIKTAGTFAEQGYLDHSVFMGMHNGTHIDAPAHMLEGAKTLDEFPVDTFVGRCRCILVKDYQFSLEEVQSADIKAGDIVIFNTGMSQRFNDPEYFTDYPAMSEDIARWLVGRGVKMVGVDTCSVDNQPGFPVHKILLGSNIPIIENLTNLESLAGAECTIYALPIKFNLDAAPARVIAEVHG